MKKRVGLVILTMCLLFLSSFSACDEKKKTEIDPPTGGENGSVEVEEEVEEESGGLLYEVNEDGVSCTIVGIGSCSDVKLVIPTKIEDYEVAAIKEEAFLDCTTIEEATIPSTVTEIGYAPFDGCKNLKKINYYASYTRGVVFYTEKEKSFVETIVYGAETLYDRFFYDTPYIENLILTDAVKSIGKSVFSSAAGVNHFSVSSSVVEIAEDAFVGLKANNISVAEGNPKYVAVNNCMIEKSQKCLIVGTNNAVIPTDGSVEIIGYAAFGGLQLESISIPSTVKIIGEMAFAACEKLKKIVIPKSVTAIEKQAFAACGLNEIVVEAGNPVYHSAGNCLIETQSKTLIAGCENSVIPSDGSVTTIGYCAFYGLLPRTLILPSSVVKIEDVAFYSVTQGFVEIYYEGTANQLREIAIGMSNWIDWFVYSEERPLENAEYFWHYDLDGKTPIVWE